MRRPPLAVAAGVLLALPLALAFFHGGYDPDARVAAAIVAWLLAAAAAVLAPAPLPRGPAARVALAGLAGLLALTLLSLAWAPLAAVAYADAQRVALYLGALVAGMALLRAGAARTAVPALAASAFAIVLVGLSERLAPWLVTLERSRAAGGRLQAPLGYWNAMGAIAAIGVVLCAGLAGDPARALRTRVIAAAGASTLGAGLILSFSRGALLAAAAGLAVVLLARPSPAQLRAAVVTVAAAAVAGVVAALLPAVKDLEGARTSQGAVLTAVIVVAALGAALAQRALSRREDTRVISLPRPRLLAAAAVVAVVGCVALVVAADAGNDEPAFGATAQRLGSVQSNRFAYWKVAVSTFAEHPLVGAGSGAFGVEWLRERTIAEAARDAHSLPIETGAELGLAGLLALALLIGGVLAGAVRLQRVAPGAAAAAFGGLAAWGVHVCLDWGWEMPSVSLTAILLAAAVLAATE
jgi:hypothetical protein